MTEAKAIVRALALRWVSDDFPGVIEAALVDADGREHSIIEKAPVVSRRDISSSSALPAELWLDARASEVDGERVHVTLAHSMETAEGLSEFVVRATDVRWT